MSREEADKILKTFSNASSYEAESLGMMNEVIRAVVKQVPQKIEFSNEYGAFRAMCPVCDKIFNDIEIVKYRYCPYCGQRIDIELEGENESATT